MQAFTFKVPTEIVFGRGAENKAAEKADKKPSLANTERNGGGLYNPNAKNAAKGKASKKINKKTLAASGAIVGLLGV